MKAYMLKSNKTIDPFNDHPRDCLIINRKLSEHQEDALKSMDCILVPVSDVSGINDSEEYIFFVDSLYFDWGLLAAFLSESRKIGRRTVCALKSDLMTLRTVVNTQDVKKNKDSVEYAMHYVPAGMPAGESTPVVIDSYKSVVGLP